LLRKRPQTVEQTMTKENLRFPKSSFRLWSPIIEVSKAVYFAFAFAVYFSIFFVSIAKNFENSFKN